MMRVQKIFKWFFIGLGCLLVITLVGGYIYQEISVSRDLARFLAPGKFIDVDGHLMHIHCQGQGSPTVIVQQGLNIPSAAWEDIDIKFSHLTKVCAYDRAGLGYSEPVDHPMRATEVAEQLNKLLHNAKIEDDIVLVGWSAGGLFIRKYYQLYPDKVKGMLFVDSAHEQGLIRAPQWPTNAWKSYQNQIEKYAAPFGLVRLRNEIKVILGSGKKLNDRFSAVYHQSHSIGVGLDAEEALKLDTQSPHPPPPIGDLPLIVLTASKPEKISKNIPPKVSIKIHKYFQESRRAWNQLHSELAALSTRGKHIITSKSGHWMHTDQPELLIDSVKELVQIVREQQHRVD